MEGLQRNFKCTLPLNTHFTPLTGTNTTHHPGYLGGRHLFNPEPIVAQRGRELVRGHTAGVWHSQVSVPPEISLTPMCYKRHLNDHRTQQKPCWAPQRAPETALKAPLGGWPVMTLNPWRTLGEGSASVDPLVLSGGRETWRR